MPASFIFTWPFGRGTRLDPTIIGPDGTLWDGLHRLAAMYTAHIPTADVLDFSQNAHYVNESRLDETLHPDLLCSGNQQVIACRFQLSQPFPCLCLPKIFRDDHAEQLAIEFDSLPWRLAQTHFYEQYEFTLLDCQNSKVGPQLRALRESLLTDQFSDLMARLTGIGPLRIADVACHRSLRGQQIGIHTDFSDEEEACRLTVHFNAGWQVDEGGLFVNFANNNPGSAVAAYPPVMNTAILFKITERSFHAVTPITAHRPRYSLVIAARKSDHHVVSPS